jgi:transcriptional regulator GlxA family with amidase domain
VQKAIELMHGALGERWTVSKLARRVGLSRPAFARRFVEETGQSPLRYLTSARMRHAAQLLQGTQQGLAQIGAQVGYGSEFAFNRAFKRFHHVAPGTFRRLASIGHSPFRMAA